MLELEPVEPAPLVAAGQLAARPRSASATYQSRWRRPDEVGLAARLELLRGELADRVEQPEPRLAVGRLLDLDQALVDERHEAVDDVAAELRGRAADGLGRLEVAAAGEDGQAVEEPPPAVVEQVVAPGDRAAQRLLARRQVARAGRQQVELVLEPGEDRVGRQELDPGGGQLDGERHAVEAGADRGDRRGVLVGDREPRLDRDRPLDEQADGLVLAEGGEVHDAASSAGQAQPLERRSAGSGSGGAGRPGTGYSCSPETRSAARLVTITLRPGAARRRSATTGAASTTCSKLSRTSRTRSVAQPVRRATSATGPGAGLRDADGRGDPRRDEHRVADRLERRRRRRRPGSRRRRRAASCSDSRVLPVPPGPVSVRSRVVASSSAASASSASRPTNVVSWVGRLFGRASSVRSGGKSDGRPSAIDLDEAVRRAAGP